jgi:chromosome segregation ATPase
MKRKIIITIIIAVAIAALGVLGVQFVRLSQENEKQQEDLKAAEELLDMEKRQAQEDLLSMQAEINEFSAMNIGNDSLIAQIEEQKQKIQLLIDELNTVKATDAKKIQELKDELSVVRTVLYDYIRKVDSLNRVNSALRNENSQMKQQVEETTTKNEQLTKDKQQLTEVVTRAAMIDVDILSVETLNKRGNVTNRLGKIQ